MDTLLAFGNTTQRPPTALHAICWHIFLYLAKFLLVIHKVFLRRHLCI